MNSFMKKKVAVLLSTVIGISTFATSGVLAASEMDGVVSQVGYAYEYVDTSDRGTITGAYARAASVTTSDVTDAGIEELMTDAFVNKYDSVNEAKAALVSLIGESLSIYYSTSVDSFETNAYAAEEGIKAVLDKTEAGITVSDWADLMIKTRKDSQNIASGVEKLVWAFGSLNGNTDSISELISTMDSLQTKAMNQMLTAGSYPELVQGLDTMGWTVEKIMAAVRAVTKYTDQFHTAEFALIKAAARSGTEIYVDGSKIDVAANQLVDWENNVYRVSPDELPMTKTVQIKIIGDARATNAAGYEVSDEEMVTISNDEDNYELDVTINDGKKGTVDIIIKRDPYADNSGPKEDWLLRQRILIAYDIEKTGTPVWGSSVEQTPVLTWTTQPGTHATKYEVVIYKDGIEVAREEATTNSFDAADIIAANGYGNYTAGVIAKGDIPEEVADESDRSEVYTYASVLGTPNAPVWTEKTLSWDAVTDATSYIVYLYRGTSAEPFKTVTVTDGTSYDASSDLAGLEGTFYAAVKAKNDSDTSALSEKSGPLVLENKYKVFGTAKLESYDVMRPAMTVYQSDNSGIVVTIKIAGTTTKLSTTTNESGEFAFGTDIPNGKHTVTFEHPTRPFLQREMTVEVNNNDKKVDTMLYYGDLSDFFGVQINPLDISALVAVLDDPASYDVNNDIDLDGEVNINELTVLLRNYGKTPKSE